MIVYAVLVSKWCCCRWFGWGLAMERGYHGELYIYFMFFEISCWIILDIIKVLNFLCFWEMIFC